MCSVTQERRTGHGDNGVQKGEGLICLAALHLDCEAASSGWVRPVNTQLSTYRWPDYSLQKQQEAVQASWHSNQMTSFTTNPALFCHDAVGRLASSDLIAIKDDDD